MNIQSHIVCTRRMKHNPFGTPFFSPSQDLLTYPIANDVITCSLQTYPRLCPTRRSWSRRGWPWTSPAPARTSSPSCPPWSGAATAATRPRHPKPQGRLPHQSRPAANWWSTGTTPSSFGTTVSGCRWTLTTTPSGSNPSASRTTGSTPAWWTSAGDLTLSSTSSYKVRYTSSSSSSFFFQPPSVCHQQGEINFIVQKGGEREREGTSQPAKCYYWVRSTRWHKGRGLCHRPLQLYLFWERVTEKKGEKMEGGEGAHLS